MTTASQATAAFMQKLGETSSEEELISMLNSEVDLNFQFDNFTPFMFAISQGCTPALVEEMLAFGANPFVCVDGINALDIAAKSHQNPEVIKMLARQGFDSEALTRALFLAAAENTNFRIILELVKAGADAYAEVDGCSLLMTAAAKNPSVEVVRIALEIDRFDPDLLEEPDDSDDSEGSEADNDLNQFRVIKSALLNPDPAILFAICEEGFSVNFLLNDENTGFLLDLKEAMPDFFSRIVRAGDVLLAADPKYLPPLSHVAMFSKDTILMSELIQAGADPDQESPSGALTLFAALANMHGTEVGMKMIECLLKNGADINLVSSKGMATLHFAMLIRQTTPEMVDYLLQSGANINLTAENGKTALDFAIAGDVDEKIVRLLLSKGADERVKDSDGFTPVHRAIERGRYDLLKLFLDNGFSIKENFYDYGSALHYAVNAFPTGLDCSHVENLLGDSIGNLCARVVELIVAAGVDVNEKDSDGQTALEFSLLDPVCHLEVVDKLIDLGAEVNSMLSHNYTPLMTVAGFGSCDSVLLLLKKGADVNARLPDGSQAIHLAAEKNSDPEVIRLLASAGADLNSRCDGKTPLHFALGANESVAVIKCLIDAGSDIEAKDENGLTSLFYAVVAEKKAIDKTKALLSAGASVNATQEAGYTPLFYATRAVNIEKILDLLLDAGADINRCCIYGYTPLYEMVVSRETTAKKLKALIARGADINAREDKYGFNGLHTALVNNDLKAARLLIDFGIDIDLPDKEGRTVLAVTVATQPLNRRMFQLLLNAGANVNATDNEGCSILHHACRDKDEETIRALLQAGADPSAKTSEGISVIDVVSLRNKGPDDFAAISELLSSPIEVKDAGKTGRESAASAERTLIRKDRNDQLRREPVAAKPRKRAKSSEKETKAPKLVITKRLEAGNILVMSLVGRFERSTMDQFLAEAEELQSVQFKDLILDFEGVSFLDAQALGALVKMLVAMNTIEKRMVIINLDGDHSALFSMIKLDEIITICEDLAAALSFLQAHTD